MALNLSSNNGPALKPTQFKLIGAVAPLGDSFVQFIISSPPPYLKIQELEILRVLDLETNFRNKVNTQPCRPHRPPPPHLKPPYYTHAHT